MSKEIDYLRLSIAIFVAQVLATLVSGAVAAWAAKRFMPEPEPPQGMGLESMLGEPMGDGGGMDMMGLMGDLLGEMGPESPPDADGVDDATHIGFDDEQSDREKFFEDESDDDPTGAGPP